MRISVNEIYHFLRCRRLWDYGSSNRKNLHPNRPAKALFLGSGVHYALEGFYAEGRDMAESFTSYAHTEIARMRSTGVTVDQQEIREEFDEAYNLGLGMLDHYQVCYGRDPKMDADHLTVMLPELEFSVPIPGVKDGLYVGRFDGIARDAHGRVYVLENKTYQSVMSQDWMQLNTQFISYAYAAQQLSDAGVDTFVKAGIEPGTHIHGTLYNGLRKALPKAPKLLKDGSMSLAAIDTTEAVYRRAVFDAHLNPRDYQTKLDELRARGNTFFAREYVMRTRKEYEIFAHYLADVYAEMANPDVRIYPTPMSECNWQCAFLSPCVAAQTGADERLLLDLNYRPREPRGVVYVDPSPFTLLGV